ncbi:MAG: FmdE family protein [Desulfatiglandales bacterium]
MHVGKYTFGEFMGMVTAFHGYPAPGVLIGGYMVEAARAGLKNGVLFEALVETSKCLPDAVQLLTPCTTGNGRIRVIDLGRFALALFDKYTGKGFRTFVDLEKLGPWSEISSWFLRLKKKGEGDQKRLLAEIEAAGDSILTTLTVQIAPHLLGRAQSGAIAQCPICKEAYPKDHGPICRGCQGDLPYVEEGPDGLRGDAFDPLSVNGGPISYNPSHLRDGPS